MTASESAQTRATPPRTVIMGCSFATLELLYRLARRRGRFAPGRMVVVSPQEVHEFIPLNHEVASGARTPEELRFDAGAFVRAIGGEWITGELVSLDAARKAAVLRGGRELPYDRLVLAVGGVTDVPEKLADHPAVNPARLTSDAMALRRRLHVLRVGGAQLLRVAVVGAGLTGVEWSAELAGGRVDGVRAAITLIGDAPRVLPRMPKRVSTRAAHALSALGVEMLLHHRVVDVGRDHVYLADGTAIAADVVVWAGGVRPNPVLASLGLPLTPRGYVEVTPRLAVRGVEGVWAVGDCARIVEREREWPTMARAIEAIWQGATLARLFAARNPEEARRPHRLRRDFWYGVSLGPHRSAVVYKQLIIESRLLVWFRRALQRAYYARFRRLARRLARRAA